MKVLKFLIVGDKHYKKNDELDVTSLTQNQIELLVKMGSLEDAKRSERSTKTLK